MKTFIQWLGCYIVALVLLMVLTNITARILFPVGSTTSLFGIIFIIWLLANFIIAIPLAILGMYLVKKRWVGKGGGRK